MAAPEGAFGGLPVFVQCCHRNGLLCFYGSMKPILFPMDAAAKAVIP